MSLTLRVTGLKEAQLALQQFPDNMKRKVYKGALNSGAEVIADDARNRVPTGKYSTGALRKSIVVRPARYRGGTEGMSVAVTAGRPPKKYRALVPTTTRNGEQIHPYWATFIEYGYKRGARSQKLKNAQALALKRRRDDAAGKNVANLFGLKSGRTRAAEKRMAEAFAADARKLVPARPFMRPALDTKAQACIDEVADYIKGNLAYAIEKKNIKAARAAKRAAK